MLMTIYMYYKDRIQVLRHRWSQSDSPWPSLELALRMEAGNPRSTRLASIQAIEHVSPLAEKLEDPSTIIDSQSQLVHQSVFAFEFGKPHSLVA